MINTKLNSDKFTFSLVIFLIGAIFVFSLILNKRHKELLNKLDNIKCEMVVSNE